jgi:hypothetical protein
VVNDSCGDQVNCGVCMNGLICNSATNKCVTCMPPTEADCSEKCGALTGCGVTVTCPPCDGGVECNETSHTCGCTPIGCSSPGACDGVSDGCGGVLSGCGSCPAPPLPPGCFVDGGASKCGLVDNACGISIDCGGCPSGLVCLDNTCTCPSPCDGVCGTVTDACTGMTQTCVCPTDELCTSNGAAEGFCCTPATQCPLGFCGTTYLDPCTGKTFPCPADNCPPGQTCGLEGSCCAPATDCPSDSCGVSTYTDPCTGNVFACTSRCTPPGVCYEDECCYALTCSNVFQQSCLPVPAGCGMPDITCITCPTGTVCIPAGMAGAGTCCQPAPCPVEFVGSFNDGCGQTIPCGE